MGDTEVNRPEMVQEIEHCFADYDRALLANDLTTLDRWFWNDPRVIRFGSAEELYGAAEIANYRRTSSGWIHRGPLTRKTVTTFGSHIATVSVEFDDSSGHGRQMQTWVRIGEEWKIVAAHVSIRTGDSPTTPSGHAE